MALPIPFVPPVTTTLRGVRGDVHTRFSPNWFKAANSTPTAKPVTAAGPAGYPTQIGHPGRLNDLKGRNAKVKIDGQAQM